MSLIPFILLTLATMAFLAVLFGVFVTFLVCLVLEIRHDRASPPGILYDTWG